MILGSNYDISQNIFYLDYAIMKVMVIRSIIDIDFASRVNKNKNPVKKIPYIYTRRGKQVSGIIYVVDKAYETDDLFSWSAPKYGR